MADLKHRETTDLILKAFYRVYNELGYGFLEKVYENALAIEAVELGLNAEQQVPIDVLYRQRKVGYYEADLVINDVVIVELKAVQTLTEVHEAQLLESHAL